MNNYETQLVDILKSLAPFSKVEERHDLEHRWVNDEKLVKRGTEFKSYKIVNHELRENNDCHRNSCSFWYNTPNRTNFSICYGYALTHDTWCSHSWLIDNKQKHLIEVTTQFNKYYGFIMTPFECVMASSINEVIDKFARDSFIKTLKMHPDEQQLYSDLIRSENNQAVIT